MTEELEQVGTEVYEDAKLAILLQPILAELIESNKRLKSLASNVGCLTAFLVIIPIGLFVLSVLFGISLF